MIGATTFNEYRKSIEKDAALERRFQPVTIEEPSHRGHGGHPRGHQKLLRELSPRQHRPRDGAGRRAAVGALYHRPLSARQGHRPHRRGGLGCATFRTRPANRALLHAPAASTTLSEEEAARAPRRQQRLMRRCAELGQRAHAPEGASSTALEKDDRRCCASRRSNWRKVIELWTGIPATKIAGERIRQARRTLPDELQLARRGPGRGGRRRGARHAPQPRWHLEPKRKPASFIFIGPTGVGKTELVQDAGRGSCLTRPRP